MRRTTCCTKTKKVQWPNRWAYHKERVTAEDRKELENVIASLCAAPGMRSSWEESPLIRPLIDENFAKFVDETLAKGKRG